MLVAPFERTSMMALGETDSELVVQYNAQT
jgi:hypothetical protein